MNFLLLHDNACLPTTMLVQQFLVQKCVAVLHHPLYSLDFSPPCGKFEYVFHLWKIFSNIQNFQAPPDYFAFSKLNLDHKGRQFEDIESVQQNVTAALKVIQQADFEQVMRSLAARTYRVTKKYFRQKF